jgi:hypothetical protein
MTRNRKREPATADDQTQHSDETGPPATSPSHPGLAKPRPPLVGQEGSFEPANELLRTRSVYDLEERVDAYGRTIYVEESEENMGKPKVWYEFNAQGVLTRRDRRPSGIYSTYLGKSPYI